MKINLIKIHNDSELKTKLDNLNRIELDQNTFNISIVKTIRTNEQFIIKGNNSIIEGDLVIKSINNVLISDLKVTGKIEILANNVYLENIENDFLTNLSAAKVFLNDTNYIFNDLFIFGNVILNNNVLIKTNGFHVNDQIVYNNFNLNIEQLSTKTEFNSQIEINDPSLKLQKCLNLTNIIDSWKYCDFNKTGVVKVAILDSGIDSDHPELIDNFLKDSENKIIGKRFFDGSSDDNFDDDNGHGTHVAGIIAAKSNNNMGITGISANNKIRIIPVKCINKFQDGYYSKNLDIANSIKWAVNQGADIINLSLGGFPGDDLIKNNIRYALNKGCLVVASAGNSSHPQKRGFVEYPAALPEVLSVGSLDEENNLSYFSSYKTDEGYPEKPEGHRGVDVVAPGSKIYSTFDHSDTGTYNNGYCYLTGTSMATPIVSGVAALLMQQHSHYYRNPSIVRKVLIQTAKDCGIPGYDQEYGYGLIDAKAALIYPYTINKPTSRIEARTSNLKEEGEEEEEQKEAENKKKNTNKLLDSIKSNSVYYGAGLAAMLGYFYFSNNDDIENWDNLSDIDIDKMSKNELLKLHQYLLRQKD